MARNRGLFFEDWIDQANAVYETKGLALIKKIPTPWQVQRKYSPVKRNYEIAFAYPTQKSTVDFGGTASKQSIWFDAKVTRLKTRFPLENIHDHQIDYLKKVQEHGGKAFLLIHAELLKKTWLLWIDDLLGFIELGERKSIPFEWLDNHCEEVKPTNGIFLDYLPIVLKKREG
jgi:recombination protein U